MPPAGPSTFLTERPTTTRNDRASSSTARESRTVTTLLPPISSRGTRHSLGGERAVTAKRQMRSFEDQVWRGHKTVHLGIVNERRLVRHGVHHLTHKLGMECNFQLRHFGRQIGELMGDLRREMKFQDDTNKMLNYQVRQNSSRGCPKAMVPKSVNAA